MKNSPQSIRRYTDIFTEYGSSVVVHGVNFLITPPSPGTSSNYCDEYAMVSVHSHNSKTARPKFTKFLCMLPISVARTSSDDVAMCYVLPVLWMTLYFNTVHGPVARIKHGVCLLVRFHMSEITWPNINTFLYIFLWPWIFPPTEAL